MTAVFPYRKPHDITEDQIKFASELAEERRIAWSAVEARYFRITFPEPGKILLKVGAGNHTVQIFELTKDDLRGLVRDAIPQLL